MGLGGAAQGATTVLALVLLVGAVLVGLLLAGLTRWLSGRWLPAVVVLVVWAAVVAIVPVRDYFSDRLREQRHLRALTSSLVTAAGFPDGSSDPVFQSYPCPRENRIGNDAPLPEDQDALLTVAAPDPLGRLRTSLTAQGYAVSGGYASLPAGTAWLLGTRGRTGVLATQASYQTSPWRDAPPGRGRLPPARAAAAGVRADAPEALTGAGRGAMLPP